jgi:ribosomal protein S18 acetylase RimI-like enzyme
LYPFNVQETGIAGGEFLGIVVNAEDGAPIAGLAGTTWGGTCEIGQLWVEPEHRRNGLGRRLMERAEEVARQRGCSQIVLATHSFQAPDFYRKLGFDEVGRINDYPRGHASIWMRKGLD